MFLTFRHLCLVFERNKFLIESVFVAVSLSCQTLLCGISRVQKQNRREGKQKAGLRLLLMI